MTSDNKRRQLLKGLIAAPCTGIGFGASLQVMPALASDGLKVSRLTDRLSLVSSAGGNVVMHLDDAGVTLFDSGSPQRASDLLTAIDDISGGAPVNTLFNTHWHEDHSGGNELVHARGAEIIAHENTRLWLTADFYVEWRDQQISPRPPEALPDTTFYNDGQKDIGSETVQYYHPEQAHTDGDIYLYLPDSNVLVTGGLMTDNTYPVCDIASGGWLGGLVSANRDMLALINDSTLVIPKSGPAKTKADLQAQHDMLSDIYDQMKALMQQGYSGQDMINETDLTAAYDEQWGTPEEFILETYRGMWAHTYDMGGFI